METFFLGIVAFLVVLAVIDLIVGVSNDAVNFLNSAVGAKAASFKCIMIVAATGIFMGALMSNGMMDIARHGIFRPENFYFQEVLSIFLSVMITDVILLDIFNSLGMPTSTTVSMVFELLGGSFVLSLLKILDDKTGLLGFGDLINTEKALSVIIAIFVSVGIAFVVGAIVQYVTRIIFTFNYKRKMRFFPGIFGGISITSILYFIFVKGISGSSSLDSHLKLWIDDNTLVIVSLSFVIFMIFSQILSNLKVNIFRIVVLLGTFALAMAFAGNDLVNFIGVPLAGLSAFTDYSGFGNGNPMGYLMNSLNEPAKTPLIYLLITGVIMIISLVKSEKAKDVIRTSVNLARQSEGDEMFGTSAVARNLVRFSINISGVITKSFPQRIWKWIDKRFDKEDIVLDDGAAFDMVRASVNLVLASLLIALGTSLKLPLSTTYVTFTVAMGTSLADRAWGRNSAVYRITGVLSVIGGWFITAGVAFILCAIITLIMHYGGIAAMFTLIVLAVFVLIRSNIRYKKRQREKGDEDRIFTQMMSTSDKDETWYLLKRHLNNTMIETISFSMVNYVKITDAFINEDIRSLRKVMNHTDKERNSFRIRRRREILGLRKIDGNLAIEKNTWFHLSCNSCEQMLYCLKRICEPCRDHVDNNFNPMKADNVIELNRIRDDLTEFTNDVIDIIVYGKFDNADRILRQGDVLRGQISVIRKRQMDILQESETNVKTSLVYLNILQESQEMVSILRNLLNANRMLCYMKSDYSKYNERCKF